MAATTCSFTSARLSGPDSERCVKDRRSATKSSLIAGLENLQPTISARLDRQRLRPVGNEKITSEERPRPQRGLSSFSWRQGLAARGPREDDLSVSGRRTDDAVGVAEKHARRLARPGIGCVAQP